METFITYYNNYPIQSLIWIGLLYSLITLIEKKKETKHDYFITAILSILLFFMFYTNVTIVADDTYNKLSTWKTKVFNKS